MTPPLGAAAFISWLRSTIGATEFAKIKFVSP